jgi:hypothetical protein
MSRQQHLGLTPLYLDGYVQIWTLAQRGAETRHDVLSSWHRRNVSSNGDVGVTCLAYQRIIEICHDLHTEWRTLDKAIYHNLSQSAHHQMGRVDRSRLVNM